MVDKFVSVTSFPVPLKQEPMEQSESMPNGETSKVKNTKFAD